MSLSTIAEAINRDPSTPGVLNHFLSNGLIHAAWGMISNPALQFEEDLIKNVLLMLSALCITDEGLELVQLVNPFPVIFNLFHQNIYSTDCDKNFLNDDLPTEIGKRIEDLLRHRPVLVQLCMDSIIAEIITILDIAEQYQEMESFGAPVKNGGYLAICFFVSAIVECLVELFERSECYKLFKANGGFSLLERLLRTPFRNSRYVLAVFACALHDELSLFTKPMEAITMCLEKIQFLDSDFFLVWVFDQLAVNMQLLQRHMKDHCERFASDPTPTSCSSGFLSFTCTLMYKIYKPNFLLPPST